METIKVVAIGRRVAEEVDNAIGHLADISINRVNDGKFGNLITLTKLIGVDEDEVISVRKRIVESIRREDPTLYVLYESSDWMSIYVAERLAFKSNDSISQNQHAV